jgi:hypothetical protein
MMKIITSAAILLALNSSALAKDGDSCLVPGEMAHWRADYCMSKVGTDDIIAAQPCLEKEWKRRVRSACSAKLHYKREMCKLSVSNGVADSVQACMQDPRFQGLVVRNGGA